ncbi:Interleukin-31 receptor subunit alpha [Apodemus speciosus]|uniref:Interleukin-31 receptor subunit alpha n=1 Tax=Apodemus speciosus TaxID=105296 RepID=A0ABQ0FH32_APOSI
MWILALWVLPLLCKSSLAVLPTKPENISCIFYFDENLNCTWRPEKETNDTRYIVRMTYSDGRGSCTGNATEAWYSFTSPCVIPPDNCSVEVEARNGDGHVKSDITYWDLTSIVKTKPPIILSVNPILNKMFQIQWKPCEKIHVFPLSCMLRFRTVNSSHWTKVNFEDCGPAYNLTGLQAFTEYVLALRFRFKDSKYWSKWSKEETRMTMEEVPHVLDLWRILEPADVNGDRKVLLLWKKARGAPVLEKTFGYNIQYFAENSTNLTEINNITTQQYELLLMNQTHRVSVTSFNSLGKSQEAVLRIPDVHEEITGRTGRVQDVERQRHLCAFQCIRSMQARIAEPLLVVSWQSSVPEVDTWIVEWLPETAESKFPALSWEYVSQVTNWTIEQDKLKPFTCYNISVYPKKSPSEGPEAGVENIGLKTATITWKEILKSKRNGFINNYTVFYQAEGGKELSKTVNSHALQCDLESLTRRTTYTVWVMASTRVGGTNGKKINFKTKSISPSGGIASLSDGTATLSDGTASLSDGTATLSEALPAYQMALPPYQMVLPTLRVVLSPKCPPMSVSLSPGKPTSRRLPVKVYHVSFSTSGYMNHKSKMKEPENSGNTEDRILKPCPVPADLIDKLVVNFENFLEVVSTEEAGKGQESVWGGEANEYVTSPSRPDCPPGKCFTEPSVLTEVASEDSHSQCSGTAEEAYLEFDKQPSSSCQGPGPEAPREGHAQNPYLRNSVTTREFLVHGYIPEHSEGDI